MSSPTVVTLAGPNGAGKSTTGPPLLKETLGVTQFVNADLIAEGLAAFDPAGAALTAGKVMLSRINELANSRATFAFETTLAGRSYARWLLELIKKGYLFHIVFLWLPSPEFALERVADRVRRGGHAVPELTVRRRFHAGLANFFSLYRPMSDTWRVFDNSGAPPPSLIAAGRGRDVTLIKDATTWMHLTNRYGDPPHAE
ncbi:MAG TPA: AAA family ATPase [Thermoanaerobaculia bacterium]|nr:AAA family ATPase [Thermoanaerobaculia bacterium]